MEERTMANKSLAFGDIITLIRVLATKSEFYSCELKSGLKKEEIISILEYFQTNCSKIPELEDISAFNDILSKVLGKQIGNVNPDLVFIFPERLPICNNLNQDFIKNADMNIWLAILRSFSNHINIGLELNKIYFKFNIPRDVVISWYGDTEPRVIMSEMDHWLKHYNIGRCYDILMGIDKITYFIVIEQL